jgi:hypothetical protein
MERTAVGGLKPPPPHPLPLCLDARVHTHDPQTRSDIGMATRGRTDERTDRLVSTVTH